MSVRKLISAEGESNGGIAREVITRQPVFDPQGMTVDAIDSLEWEESKDEIRKLRVLVIIIDGGPRKRGIQACEIQCLSGGYYVCEIERYDRLDFMTLDKIKKAGGTTTVIDDQRLRTNSPVLMHRIPQEKERRAWTEARGINSCRELS